MELRKTWLVSLCDSSLVWKPLIFLAQVAIVLACISVDSYFQSPEHLCNKN